MYRHLTAASAAVMMLAFFGCNQPENLSGSVNITDPSKSYALSTTGSLTLKSGQNIVSGRDAANKLVACSGSICPSGSLPQDALVIPQHSAYAGTLPGTSYINPTVNPPSPGYSGTSVATFRNTFSLPANIIHASGSASITISIIADNAAAVRINGVSFVAQTDPPCNFCSGQAPKTYSTTFTPSSTGINVLEVDLTDFGGAAGLDYLATVTYELAPVVSCPEGYTDGAAFESFSVNANGANSPVFNPPSFTPLIAGRPYLAEVTGAYHFAGGANFWRDALYATGNNWTAFDGPYTQYGLAINGVSPNWGPYNSSHAYKAVFYGTGGATNFRILDDAYGDNSGSMNVTLSTCDPLSQPTTTTVTFGPGPFVYDGSAFTATASVSPAEAGEATITYSGDCVNAGGTCTATATFAGSSGFDPSSASASITIEKAPTTTSVSFGSGPFVYTGSAFTATASVSPAAAGSATIAYSGDCVNAGSSCTATATYAGNGNYLPSSASAGITIEKAPTATSVSFGSGPFIYTGSAFTAAASVSPAAAGSATIAYSGDCVYAGNTCMATATYAGNGNYLPSGASTGIVIKYPVATNADMCKKGGWQFATDDLGNLFKNQGDCVSYVATKGKNKGSIAP